LLFSLTIKGRPGDDAVLCTSNSTFLLRTVTVSNSLLVCRDPETTSSPSDSDAGPSRPTLEIRDICHAILEPLPHAPNLERIRTILRPSAWKGLGEDAALEKGRGKKRRRAEGGEDDEVRRYTRAQLESVIQASDAELEKGLRERNVVEVEGRSTLTSCPVADRPQTMFSLKGAGDQTAHAV
jgi:sister chromatid cohesion protein DCC1